MRLIPYCVRARFNSSRGAARNVTFSRYKWDKKLGTNDAFDIKTRSNTDLPSFLSSNMALSMDTCRSVGFFVSTLAVLLASFQLTEAGGKTLVLVDNANTKETHSIFFNSLKGKKKLHYY